MQSKIKSDGVIYTPEWVVDIILNLSSFKYNIYGKKILEPSCGDGAFLTKIVERIILDAKNNNIDKNSIKTALSSNIYGIDIDGDAIKKCKNNLNLLCKKYELYNINWKNIIQYNSLSDIILEKYDNYFDFIFGNPPYVRIQNLNKQTRSLLEERFKLCSSGSTDLYIAFFELGFNLLNKNGILGYITPNSFINSAAGNDLRKYFMANKNLKSIVDFKEMQVFEKVTTYSLISIYDKSHNSSDIDLYYYNDKKLEYSRKINTKSFDDKWILEPDEDLKKINYIKNRGIPLGKLCKIHTGIATLKDDLFIFKDPKFNGNVAEISLKDGRKFKIEKDILKKIIKASTWKSSDDDQKLFIIFPYLKINNKTKIINEENLKEKFPLTFNYFTNVKKELLDRDKRKPNPVSWYAFGRSQGLDTAFGKKIITSPINKNPNFIMCNDENSIYYSGYSIVYDGDYEKLINLLNSNDMKFFIEKTSKSYRGGYKSYAKSFIKDFGIEI